ncbi:MAG: pyridoxal phosphate-dependent aminotransferase [Candidatus Tectomicrobia bacterium]|uniref:Pyridoxal phosphate-dependent aminotransferase n=1 Tax=Tectimicrobiota bacterium TaxID=2528274 RepID=A0A932GNJ3_UNCTE|nr:pyridoxal phosphate-dependent aminotransferase [Candidatus Tectomicrobia bacterium]
MSLAQRINRIQPSATLEMTALANSMKAQGIDVIGLAAGEPDFDTQDHVKEAAIAALRQGFTKYTPVGGTNDLKEAICEKFQRENGVSYKPAEVTVSCGAKHSLYNLFQVLFEAGDEVLIPSPYWTSYPDMIVLTDAKPVIVSSTMESGYKINPEILKRHITPKTKALILNSPSNPTGVAYSPKEIKDLVQTAMDHNLTIISDEIYEHITFEGFQQQCVAALGEEVKKRTLTVNGPSKTYAMTGWRIGYLAGSAEIVSAVTKLQGQSTSNPTSIAQKATVAALKGPQDEIRRRCQEFERRRNVVVEKLRTMPGVSVVKPDGTFYAFPRFDGAFGKRYGDKVINSSGDLATYLLKEAQVVTVPGDAFGDDRALRLSFATSMEIIEEGLKRIGTELQKLS